MHWNELIEHSPQAERCVPELEYACEFEDSYPLRSCVEWGVIFDCSETIESKDIMTGWLIVLVCSFDLYCELDCLQLADAYWPVSKVQIFPRHAAFTTTACTQDQRAS